MSGVQQITVESGDADQRLDRWFKRRFPELTHGRLEKLLRTGQVRLDGKRAKASDRVAAGSASRSERSAGLRTAVAGDAPPLMGLSRLPKLPHRMSSRALVRGSLPAVPPASRSSTCGTVRGHGPGCFLRLERPCRV